MPALNVMTTCDTLASSASRMVCIRSCESGRAGLFPMSAPWMDSATSASTKTGIALLRTLSSTTGPAWESRTSIVWTRMSDELRSEEHTSELQSQSNLVCRLLLEKKKKNNTQLPSCTHTIHS